MLRNFYSIDTMAKINIKGTVQYQSIGTGFWGIIGEDGKKWRPTNLPEHLKTEGKQVSIAATQAKEQFSIFMWGTAIDILDS